MCLVSFAYSARCLVSRSKLKSNQIHFAKQISRCDTLTQTHTHSHTYIATQPHILTHCSLVRSPRPPRLVPPRTTQSCHLPLCFAVFPSLSLCLCLFLPLFTVPYRKQQQFNLHLLKRQVAVQAISKRKTHTQKKLAISQMHLKKKKKNHQQQISTLLLLCTFIWTTNHPQNKKKT